MPTNRLIDVEFLQVFFFLSTQDLSPRFRSFLHALHTAEPDDRTADSFVDPRQRHLADLPPLLLRQLFQPPDDLFIFGRCVVVECDGSRNGGVPRLELRPLCIFRAGERSGQFPLRERRPRYQAHSCQIAEFVHFPLFLAIEQVVLVLHGDEFRPAVLFGAELHEGKLVGPHTGGADVADFAGADEVVQCGHCFFDGGGGVEAVDLVEVYIGGVETFEGGVDSGEDCLAGESCIPTCEALSMYRKCVPSAYRID